jgi:hypothetical protein
VQRSQADGSLLLSTQCSRSAPDLCAELYDTILHESVHVAQACKGGPLFNPESIYRFALATEVDLVKKAYSNSQSLIELEARVIAREQDEVFVTNLIKEHCK